MRVEPNARRALASWHEHAPTDLRPSLQRLARRLELGDRAENVVGELEADMGPAAASLASILSVHAELGGDSARMLEGLADSLEQSATEAALGRAASAGALLSGRMVAGLPLIFLPLTPLTRAPLLDLPGIVMLLLGAGLAVTGMRWIGTLIPVPPAEDDPVAAVADGAAAVVRGGVGLDRALEAIANHSTNPLLARAHRIVCLGCSWSDALRRADDEGLVALAYVIDRTEVLGLPVAGALEGLARHRRVQRSRDFERAVRRAPVLMVVPLTLCVLPSFGLLALGPFLRGLSLS